MVRGVSKPRQFERYARSSIASLVTAKGELFSGHLVDVGYGGLAVRLQRRGGPSSVPVEENESVRLRVVDPSRGAFRVSGLVRWVRVTALQMRLGLELDRADPGFYGLVMDSARRS